MPAKAVWLNRLPEILHELRQVPDCQEVGAKDVAELLEVKTRSVQDLLSAAGATREFPGGPFTITVELLRRYLLSRAPKGFEETERKRRRHVAAGLTEGLQHLLDHPDKFREIGKNAELKPVRRHYFSVLPESIEIEPGRIGVRFEKSPAGLKEGLMDLMQFCIAATEDFEELERRTELAQ